MKKGFGKGFATGILVAALTVGLGVSALAATRTITVDDNIRVTINGATFTPKNEQGKEVPLFSYNGTTYAPVRAICEAAGLKVDFDSSNYTAVLTTQDQYIASTPNASNYITVEKAKQAALSHAGVSAANAIFVKAGLDWDDGKVCYEVEDEALLSVLLPRMSIQPLVENAIYHGLETKVGKGDISIKATEYQSRIEISIRDNGTGIADEKLRQLNLWLAQGRNPKEMRAEQVGIALLNVNKRVALRFGGEYGLRIYSTVGYGTDVRLTIPKTTEEAG